jgi:hypothetical protein
MKQPVFCFFVRWRLSEGSEAAPEMPSSNKYYNEASEQATSPLYFPSFIPHSPITSHLS